MGAGSRLARWAGHRQRSLGVKGEGYGSNRSREGPNTSSPQRWSAERGRHRAGPPRLARSKGPAEYRDDDGGQQVANPIPPRSRPYGLMSADAPGRVRVGCFLRAWCGVFSARAAVGSRTGARMSIADSAAAGGAFFYLVGRREGFAERDLWKVCPIFGRDFIPAA